MTPARQVVVFARAPRLGQVKSRLAADIGTVGAWRFYRRTLAETLRRIAADGRWITWVAVTPERAIEAPWPRGVRVIGQGRGDLGVRMARFLARLPPGPVVIVGSDLPGLRRDHVARAFAALGRHPMVFGPAADGGFWLVGARRRPFLPWRPFTRVRWSSAHALADTLAGLDRRLSVGFLETLTDVDTGADLRRALSRQARPR